jgi:MFS family permease
MTTVTGADKPAAADTTRVGGPYAWYVLGVLVVVYMFNFIDRQIIAILAEDIKRDLGISDTEIGFLYGTAFAIFYALFGIPLGRLADMWLRTRLLALGLTLWSGMTAVSGFASSFAHLAFARIGVGIGEASASPCAYSLLSDYFPKEKRATVLAIYSGGLFLGGGVSLFIGGLIVDRWNAAYPETTLAPLGLAGWQAAFLAVGIPGLILALLVALMKEPVRGAADGLVVAPEPKPWGKFWTELTSVIPPLTLVHLFGIGGTRALTQNLMLAAGVAAAAYCMIAWTGDLPQWIAVGIGTYAVASWVHSIRLRDKPTFALIWGTPAFVYAITGFGLISFSGYALAVFTAPYAVRQFELPLAQVGLMVGGLAAATGFLGVIAGGWLGDKLKAKGATGRLWIGFAAAAVPAIPILVMFTTDSLALFYTMHAFVSLFGSMWVGVGAATTQDLVLPRMRGAATATYLMAPTLLGLALGPYFAGRVSKALTATYGPADALAIGLMATLMALPVIAFCLWRVAVLLPQAEATRLDRARAAGEPA